MAAGDAVSEWGHYTPRFPRGIGNEALSRATEEVQTETALFWFHLNLREFDQTKGGPWFGLADEDGTMGPNLAGLDVGMLAPQKFDSLSIFTAEFGTVLPENLIAKLAAELPGDWEWLDVPPPAELQPHELVPAVLAGLAQLREQVTTLRAVPEGIGHNSAASSVRGAEATRILAGIDDLEKVLQEPRPDKEDVRDRWTQIWQWVSDLTWFTFKNIAEGILKRLGGDVYDYMHHVFMTWDVARHTGGLLDRLLDLWK